MNFVSGAHYYSLYSGLRFFILIAARLWFSAVTGRGAFYTITLICESDLGRRICGNSHMHLCFLSYYILDGMDLYNGT